MMNFKKYRRAFQHLLDRLVIWFWLKMHPCRVGLKEYDHELKYIDDSFSHEYGTEVCGHWECENCGYIDEKLEPPSDDYLFDY